MCLHESFQLHRMSGKTENISNVGFFPMTNCYMTQKKTVETKSG